MEIKHEDGKVISTMTLSEACLSREVYEKMNEDQRRQANEEIHDLFSSMVFYPYQPERSKREDSYLEIAKDYKAKQHLDNWEQEEWFYKGVVEFAEYLNMRCGALNTVEIS
jgi:hypothetical protein